MRKEQEGDFNMQHTTPITIEHIVVESNQPYEKVVGALEARLGPAQDWAAIGQQAAAAHASWEQFTQEEEAHIGTSGLSLFYKFEHGFLFSLVGKTSRAIQYTIGNPLLAMQMTKHQPEAALYAPLRLVVYEDEEGKTFAAYDSFLSLLAQYQREEITQVARVVEQKLEALVAEVTAEGRADRLTHTSGGRDASE
jgi:uncharacterized protein (DUF302 family)